VLVCGLAISQDLPQNLVNEILGHLAPSPQIDDFLWFWTLCDGHPFLRLFPLPVLDLPSEGYIEAAVPARIHPIAISLNLESLVSAPSKSVLTTPPVLTTSVPRRTRTAEQLLARAEANGYKRQE
jgi:hypothetical protein